MAEYKFSYQDYDHKEAKTFYVDYYPINKEASDNIDYDTFNLPKEINIARISLISEGAIIGYDDNCAVNHVENLNVNFEVPNSAFKDVKNVSARVEITKIVCLGNLFTNIALPEKPEVARVQSEFHNSIGGISIESIEIEYSLEGKKTKKINQLKISCIATNKSSESRMVVMHISGQNGDERKLINEPGPILVRNSFAEESTVIDPGKSALLRLNIFSAAAKFEDIGIALPVAEQLLDVTVHPFLRIYGDASVETSELSDPVFV